MVSLENELDKSPKSMDAPAVEISQLIVENNEMMPNKPVSWSARYRLSDGTSKGTLYGVIYGLKERA